MFISIRVSPVFASYVSQIPGLEKIVQLINYDKGLKLAVENEFMQPIGASDEHEGIKLTIDGIIIDESQMVVFYTLENKSEYEEIYVANPRFYDEFNEPVIASISQDYYYSEEKQEVIKERIDIIFTEETTIPDMIYLETKMGIGHERQNTNLLGSTWKIQLPIDKSKFEGLKEVYHLNKEIEIEGQKIIFKSVTVHPTKIAVEVVYDNNNSKQIFGFDDLVIVDETGEELSNPNGVIGFGSPLGSDTHTIFLQSNYFNKPKDLFLKFTSVKALEKDKLEIIVDLKEKKLLKSPDDRVSLTDIRQENGETKLIFSVQMDPILDKMHSYSIFSGDIIDNNGKKYYSGNAEFSNIGDNQQITFILPNNELEGPIILKIGRYPTRIKGEFKIQVK